MPLQYSTMDLLLHASLLFASLSLLSFFFLFRPGPSSKAGNLAGPKLPPGPTALPVIGSIHHLLLRLSLPHQALRDLARTHGPLMHLRLGQLPIVVVSSPEAAREVMKTHDTTFATRPPTLATKILTYGAVDLILAPYGEYWRQLRKLCVLEVLSAKRVQSSRCIREEEVGNLVRSIGSMPSSSPVNVSDLISSLTNNITARAIFGSKCQDQNRCLLAISEAMRLGSGFQLVDLFPGSMLVRLITAAEHKIRRSHQEIDRILERILKEHKTRKIMSTEMIKEQENLLDVLLTHQDQQQGGEHGFSITTNTIKAIIFDLIAAGTDTSSSAMAWAMSEMIKNPRVMKKAQEEVREVLRRRGRLTEEDTTKLSYLKLVIKETLRLHPPVPLLLPRECTETCEIQGYQIPATTKVLVNAWAMGRDPQYWDDSEDFKPERFDNSPIDFKGATLEFIPFGAGRRICPGMQFGLANMELPLAHLLCYFDWKLPHGLGPDDLDMTESFRLTAARKSDLCLCATPHASLPMA